MATFAAVTKTAVVWIVIGVAADASGLRSVAGRVVALRAAQLRVSAVERKIGLHVMVELRMAPTAWVVTCRALIAQIAFVNIVGLMAAGALTRCSGEALIDMAFLTGDDRVQPDYWETAEIVLKSQVL